MQGKLSLMAAGMRGTPSQLAQVGQRLALALMVNA
jgi:hypothetical protein